MELEDFKTLTDVIQNIFLVLGVIVAGIWSLILFKVKKEAEISRVAYDKMKRDLQDFRLISLVSKASYFKIKENIWQINLTVTFQNTGNDTEILYWEENNFKVCCAWIDENEKICREYFIGHRMEYSDGEDRGIRLLPNTTTNALFISQVNKKGYYLLEIIVKASPEEQTQAQKDGAPSEVSWKDFAHIVIK
jgi:hypothetical protein